MDFTKDKFHVAYRELFDNIGMHHSNMGNLITPAHFSNGLPFFAFDLSPDKCAGFHRHLPESGNIDIDLSFGRDVEKGVIAIFHATYHDSFELDMYGNATMSGAIVNI